MQIFTLGRLELFLLLRGRPTPDPRRQIHFPKKTAFLVKGHRYPTSIDQEICLPPPPRKKSQNPPPLPVEEGIYWVQRAPEKRESLA